MVVYNETFMQNSTNIADLMIGMGSSIGEPYLMGYLILSSVIFILFVTLKGSTSLASSGVMIFMISMVLSFLLVYAGLLPVVASIVMIALFMICLIAYLTL